MEVELTRDIYLFAKEHGYLLIDDSRQNARRRVDVAW